MMKIIAIYLLSLFLVATTPHSSYAQIDDCDHPLLVYSTHEGVYCINEDGVVNLAIKSDVNLISTAETEEFLAYLIINEEGLDSLHVYQLNNGEIITVAEKTAIAFYWLADTNVLLYMTWDSEITVYNADTPDNYYLYNADTQVTEALMLPQSRYVDFDAETQDLYLFGTEGLFKYSLSDQSITPMPMPYNNARYRDIALKNNLYIYSTFCTEDVLSHNCLVIYQSEDDDFSIDRTFAGEAGGIRKLTISPDGQYLAFLFAESIVIYDYVNQAIVFRHAGWDIIPSFDWLPDTSRLWMNIVSSENDHLVSNLYIYDLATEEFFAITDSPVYKSLQ